MTINSSLDIDIGTGTSDMNLDIHSLLSPNLPYEEWVPLQASGWRPPARYKHATEVVDEKLYIIGGSRNGRYLSDIQVFDLRSSTWTQVKRNQESKNVEDKCLPAISGHSLVKWEDKLLVVAGHSKGFSDKVTVWSIELTTLKCVPLTTHGKVPIARGGQSVTLVGSKLLMFGGEDIKRRVLNDLHILDLETMCWDVIESGKSFPAPRFDHAAAAYADRYLLIFGGCSHSTCFSDLHVLDLQNMGWSEIQAQGEDVSPRAGHAGATIGETWYIVGGGDNRSGASQTVKLNMSKLVWQVATSVAQWDPLASEGVSVNSTTVDGEKFLLAFGGYNGKYHNQVFVLKPKPSTSSPPRILQSSAAAAAAASVTAAYAFTSMETRKVDSVSPKDEDPKQVEPESSSRNIGVEISATTMEKKMLASRLSEIRDENSKLKGDLSEFNSLYDELSMELQSVLGQLEAERSRCSKLELQAAEIQKRLELQNSIEHELEILRHQNSSHEDLMEAKRQNSGVWKWMAGAT